MKKCSKCNIEKDHVKFHKKISAKDGLFQWCIDCHRIITRTRYSERLKDKIFAGKENNRVLAWRKDNPEKYKEQVKNYLKENNGALAAKVAVYRSKKAHRTPKWLTEDEYWVIKEIYKLASLRTKTTGIKWEVDHIIPLHGNNVSGLHVPINLQVIPKKHNQTKSNKFN